MHKCSAIFNAEFMCCGKIHRERERGGREGGEVSQYWVKHAVHKINLHTCISHTAIDNVLPAL